MPRPALAGDVMQDPATPTKSRSRSLEDVLEKPLLPSEQLTSEVDKQFKIHLDGLLTAFQELQQQNFDLSRGTLPGSVTAFPGRRKPSKNSVFSNGSKGSKFTKPAGHSNGLTLDSTVQSTGIAQSSRSQPVGAYSAQSEESKPEEEKPEDLDLSDKREQLLELFRRIDQDGQGTIGIDEMRDALKAVGEHPARARRLLEAADTNGDGEIEYDEWLEVVDTLTAGNASEHMTRIAKSLVRKDDLAVSKTEIESTATPLPQFPPCMLHCWSRKRLAWDIFMACLLVYLAVVLPFNFGFMDDENSGFFQVVGILVDICFTLDIGLNFRTTYMNKEGVEVTDGRAIAVNYLTTWFALDFCSSIPLEHLSTGLLPSFEALKILKGGKLIKVLKMLRAVKLVKIMQASQIALRVEEAMMLGNYQSNFDMVRILATCCYLCHFLACLMAISGSGFLDQYRRNEDTLASKYCSALYWSVTTVTTVGYGDITPASDEERLFTMFAMLVGGSFYGYVVGNISVIISNRDVHKRSYRERMRLLASWLGHHRFPKALRHRIWIYYKSYQTNKMGLDETKVLDDLSPELRHAVADFLVHAEVRNNLIFHNLPASAMVRLLPLLQLITAEAGEHVTSKGQIGHAMFIIVGGSADRVHHKSSQKKIKTQKLDVGDSFGEEVLLGMKQSYDYTVTASTVCQLFMIRAELFVERFADLPQVVDQMRRNFLD